VAFALAAVQITVVVNTLLASLLPAGSVSYLYYADRIMEFPLGVFGAALATAALPGMSAQAARQDHQALSATLGFALRLSAFITVPAAVGLVTLATPIVRLLFERGEFGAADVLLTSQALVGYAVGLPAFSATRLAAQTFYALGDVRTPVYIGFAAVAANLFFALSLMGPLGHAGLALASSLSSYVNLVGLCLVLRRRRGLFRGQAFGASLARTAGASTALLVWCVGFDRWLGGAPHPAIVTLLVLASGVLVFGLSAAALRAPELKALLGLLRREPRLPSGGSG
jgi:putative peptidoglycan lipid II flippase